MLTDEAQSSNASILDASIPGADDSAQVQALHIFNTRSLLEQLRRMDVTVDASAMQPESTPSEPLLDASFLQMPQAVWEVLANRRQHYAEFRVPVHFQLKKSPFLPAHSPITGLHAKLVEDEQLHSAILHLLPVAIPMFNTAHAIDVEVLAKLAPRITQQGQEGNYPALLKTITRMAFEDAIVGMAALRGNRLLDEKTLASQMLNFLANDYVAHYPRTSLATRSRKANPELVLKLAQQMGSKGMVPFTNVLRLLQAFEENFPGKGREGQHIVRDMRQVFAEQDPGTQDPPSSLLGYHSYFEGPIVSVDSSRASAYQKVRDSRGREYEHEHTGLSEHALQRLEIIRKGWLEEPVAVDVINGVTHVAPLECAQRLSLHAAYEAGIIPREDRVMRVNASLQEKTPEGASYEGQFLGATSHHIYLLNFEGNYEAHLKCLLKPQDVAKLAPYTLASDASPVLRIDYAGPMQSASMGLAQTRENGLFKTMVSKLRQWFGEPKQRAENYAIWPLSEMQYELLHRAAVHLLGHPAHEVLHPTQAMNRAELASSNFDEVRAAILADGHDGVVWGHRPSQRVFHAPSVSELGSGSDVADADGLFSLGSFSSLRHLSPTGSEANASRVSTRTNSPVSSRSLSRSSTPRVHTTGSLRVSVDMGR